MFVKRKPDGSCLYHISYQYYHGHTQWGPPSQATAISKDGVHWTDVGDALNPSVFVPGATPYDSRGVYDGTILPGVTFRVCLYLIQADEQGGIVQIYTAVSILPMGWTLPYESGTERQCLAYSLDEGQSWKAYEGEPVIPSPPAKLDITGELTFSKLTIGFRDPFIFHSATLNALLPREHHNCRPAADTSFESDQPLYLAVSGGDRVTGCPLAMLYRNEPGTILKWEYLGQVGDLDGGVVPNEWSANTGHNYGACPQYQC